MQPKLVLNGVSLAKIASFVNECVDVIGIIESVADIQQVSYVFVAFLVLEYSNFSSFKKKLAFIYST